MTDTAPPTTARWTRWLYPALAITGIAVGIFVVAAGLYLIFWPSDCCPSHSAKPDCCAGMEDKMKNMHADMKMPHMSPMPSMSPTHTP